MTGSDKAVYVIVGSAGAYSDHREWIVCAYANEADANLHAERAGGVVAACNEQYRSAWEQTNGFNMPEIADFEGDTGIVFTNPWDPDPESDTPVGGWSERHRFHATVVSLGESLRYDVWTVPLMPAVPSIPGIEAI